MLDTSTDMSPKAAGYWLFVLDMRHYVSVLSGKDLHLRELNYLGANIWSDVSVNLQERYKTKAKAINACKGPIVSPLIISEADFIYLTVKLKLSHVWDMRFESKLIQTEKFPWAR